MKFDRGERVGTFIVVRDTYHGDQEVLLRDAGGATFTMSIDRVIEHIARYEKEQADARGDWTATW